MAAVVLYGAAVCFMWAAQRNLLYPSRGSDVVTVTIRGIPRATDVNFNTRDGVILRGWRIAPAQADALTYLYFQGNAGGLERRSQRFGLMTADGSGLLSFSYRGYDGSGSAPSEAALHGDAAEIYDRLAAEIGEDHIVLVGESLGTGIALNLARTRKPRAIILDSPYVSVLDRATKLYPWLPVAWLLDETFRSDLFISEVTRPILILHGTADRVIPVADSARLSTFAEPGIVTRRVYPGEGHVVPWNHGPDKDVPAFLATTAAFRR